MPQSINQSIKRHTTDEGSNNFFGAVPLLQNASLASMTAYADILPEMNAGNFFLYRKERHGCACFRIRSVNVFVCVIERVNNKRSSSCIEILNTDCAPELHPGKLRFHEITMNKFTYDFQTSKT